MPAYVGEHPHAMVLVVDDEDGLSEQDEREVIAGGGELFHAAHRDPFAPKNPPHFQPVEFRIHVGIRRKCHGFAEGTKGSREARNLDRGAGHSSAVLVGATSTPSSVRYTGKSIVWRRQSAASEGFLRRRAQSERLKCFGPPPAIRKWNPPRTLRFPKPNSIRRAATSCECSRC